MKHLPIAVLAFLFLDPAASGQSLGTSFFESSDFGSSRNLGAQINLFGGAMSVTARYQINPSATTDLNASGLIGTIYLDADSSPHKGGLGVQNASAATSTGISGGGPNQDEELIFTYESLGASLNTIQIMINNFDSAATPILFLNTDQGSFVFNTAQIQAAGFTAGSGTDAAKSWTVNFSGFAAAVGNPDAIVQSFIVRETTGHTFVRGVTGGTLIPEPGTTLLAAFALPLLMQRRRKAVPHE